VKYFKFLLEQTSIYNLYYIFKFFDEAKMHGKTLNIFKFTAVNVDIIYYIAQNVFRFFENFTT